MAVDNTRRATTALVALAFCISGSALTILNKLIMAFLPAPNLVLFAQNFVTLLLLKLGYLGSLYELETFQKQKAIRWLPLVCLFYVMLASSMLSLKTLTATTLIVQRNLGTVSVAIADYFYIGTLQNRRRIISIAGICFGSVWYVLGAFTGWHSFDFYGYVWLAVNIASITAYQIKVKLLVKELDLNSWTMAYYNNMLSLPFCLIFSLACRETGVVSLFLVKSISFKHCMILSCSCSLGFCLSISAFQLNRLITPTSITVLNNTNKFIMMFLTAFFMDYYTLTTSSMIGALCVLGFATYYSLASNN